MGFCFWCGSYVAINPLRELSEMKLKKMWYAGLMALVAGMLYWPSLHHPIFFDDVNFFERSGLNVIFLRGFAFDIRWLPYFLTAWIDLIFMDNIFVQRIVNVVLHFLCAYVLYHLISRISNHVAPHRNNERAALGAALLFLAHPLAVYATGYLIQRTILMATLFGLVSLGAYFDGLTSQRKAYFLFSAFFYFLSTFSKEHAVLLPLVALALTPLAIPINPRTWRQLVVPFSLFLPIATLVVLESQSNLGRVYEPFAQQLVHTQVGEKSHAQIWALSMMTQATLFFKYVSLMLVPYSGWMSIDMRVPFASNFLQPKYLLGVVAFAAYGLKASSWLLKGGRLALIGFALLAPLLLFAVECSTVRIQEPFVLYRAYLWLPLFFFLLPPLSASLTDRLFWGIVLVMLLCFTVSASDRLKSFSSEFALWDDAVRKLPSELAPGSARTHANRGYLNFKRGDFTAAVGDLTRALEADPEYKKAYEDRAIAFMKLGAYARALQDANAVIRLHSDDQNLYALRAVIHRAAGQESEAIADFEYACRKKSVSACVALNKGTRYVVEGGAK